MTDQMASSRGTTTSEPRQAPNNLLARVEAATGPDREIDTAILLALGFHLGRQSIANSGNWYDDASLIWRHERLTASLDAVLMLAKRLGFFIRSEPRFFIESESVVYYSHALRPRWDDWRPDDEWFDRGEAKHSDQVLSALAALLRALNNTASPATACSGDADTEEGP